MSFTPANLSLAAGLVPLTYVQQGEGSLSSRGKLLRVLLSQRSVPRIGWDDASVGLLLAELAVMDSNNFVGRCGRDGGHHVCVCASVCI